MYEQKKIFNSVFMRSAQKQIGFHFGCIIVDSRCLHEAGIKKCSHRFEVIPVAHEPTRLSSDWHRHEPVRDVVHVNKNYFQSGPWLNKAYASHVHNVHTCSQCCMRAKCSQGV